MRKIFSNFVKTYFSRFYKFWRKKNLSLIFYLIKKDILLCFLNKKILQTRSFTLDPAADVEVHSLISSRDLGVYLLAIKSLLRFSCGFKVVVHDDGSLTERDKDVLRQHVQGIKIIDRSFADKVILQKYSGQEASLFLREQTPNFMQVMDYFVLSESKKVIGMDSDVLFFQYPQALMDWVNGHEEVILYNFQSGVGLNSLKESDFTGAPFKVSETGINCGFFCAYKGLEDPDLLEKFLKLGKEVPGFSSDIFPNYAILAQNAFSVLVLNSRWPAKPLPEMDYKVLCNAIFLQDPALFAKDSVFKHYAAFEHRFLERFQYVRDLKRIISGLTD